ncbi:ATP-dependent helicase [Actinoplanes sp. CA-030573]|uniref:ATP-dependent helicase n=1 Tax=Actinoplanes sp. CA-030573 TaxID=3239898 RepID=UPI003D92B279
MDAEVRPAAEIMLSAALADEIAALHPRQREAALHEGDVVILAGPGSGKTRTLVARVGYLLATTGEHRGVAAITYTDAAARELSSRLRKMGLALGRRLASRTVHAFCLNHVLRPYGRIAGRPLPADFRVPEKAEIDRLWSGSLSDAGVHFNNLGSEVTTVTRLRRRAAAGEDVQNFTREHRHAVRLYEQRLAANHLLDFDEMTHRAMRVLGESSAARELLTARFPHLVIDEYQDLGPVLDVLVTTLHDAGMTVTAVGDPDQTMYEFQGAHPRYLRTLGTRLGCEPVQLTLNYRSGSAIVAAARATLGEDRGYAHDPRRVDPGVIELRPVDGDLDAHADRTVEVVQELLANGTAAEDMAILYPGQTTLHDLIEQALTDAGIAFDNERGRRMPDGPVAELIMACAARRLAGPLPGKPPSAERGQVPSKRSAGGAAPPPVREIAAMWSRLLQESESASPTTTVRLLARRLLGLVDAAERELPQHDCEPFWAMLSETLAIQDLTSGSRDHKALDKVRSEVAAGLTMAELAGGRSPGHIIMTTYHSSKGREFPVVILPGLIEGLVPFVFAGKRLTPYGLEVARRKFYVAVTRATNAVVLIPGNKFTAWGRTRSSKWSRFVSEIQQEVIT